MLLTLKHSGLKKGVYTPPETPHSKRQEFRTGSRSPRKSVAFDLDSDSPSQDSHPEPGYDADDSDSTDDFTNRRYHSQRFPRSPYPSVNKSDFRNDYFTADKDRHRSSPGSDSDSTIDLPDRFDSQGRLLSEPRSAPVGNSLQGLLDRMFA